MTAVWSLNEIQSLAHKAVRGSGYGWGVAEDAGQAVRWLLARDLPGADAVLAVCEAGARSAPETCPLTIGCALSDGLFPVLEFGTRPVVSPLLILPFLAWRAERDKVSLSLSWQGCDFVVGTCGELSVKGKTLNPGAANLTISAAVADRADHVREAYRASVDCEVYVALSRFAGRTYAPSTQASRESGAGAGLTDND
ncbi:DUF3726 domain-containing protein [Boseongicola aestuarii]|uniref:DUF3726 domain-containing protein n=1 Tax=Boseongicola aestuarii TaxID=1470561 RepID=A0A238IZI0_9RHOB|nr:DUF3726 domain-containing protein [Boseongicola aestuarii]SMX23888.1 hypothetical protein BOA8489_02001 [Boseongicola aestuarii]